jgi:hypothetical protein
MFVYNISIKITPEIESKWVQWQMQEHIPEMMSTNLFSEYKFFHLLEQDETDGITYVVQFFTPSMAKYNEYIEKYAPQLRKKALDKWGNNFIAFRTIMELVQ